MARPIGKNEALFIAFQLFTNGVVVINDWLSREQLDDELIPQWENERKGMKEFHTEGAAAGGFGAFGNPSSYHSPTPRTLRVMLYNTLRGMLEELGKLLGFNLVHVVPDRWCERWAGTVLSGESAHRDSTPSNNPGFTLGGFIAVKNTQVFTCVPGTHGKGQGGGFDKLSEEESLKYSSQMVQFEVRPGSVILFSEDIVHKVSGGKIKETIYRLFVSFHLGNTPEPLIATSSELRRMFRRQEVMPLKSGQMPPMYPKLYPVNHFSKLLVYSGLFKPECLNPYTIKSGKKAGETFMIPHRVMRSLEEMNPAWKYQEYTEREIGIYIPHPLNAKRAREDSDDTNPCDQIPSLE